MVDVLLTHSYHLYYDRKQVRKMQPYPPLGTLYAAALLRQQGFSVALFDTMLEDPESGFPVVGTQAQFLAPARMDDILEVRTWVARIGRASLSLRHEIVRIEAR